MGLNSTLVQPLRYLSITETFHHCGIDLLVTALGELKTFSEKGYNSNFVLNNNYIMGKTTNDGIYLIQLYFNNLLFLSVTFIVLQFSVFKYGLIAQSTMDILHLKLLLFLKSFLYKYFNNTKD